MGEIMMRLLFIVFPLTVAMNSLFCLQKWSRVNFRLFYGYSCSNWASQEANDPLRPSRSKQHILGCFHKFVAPTTPATWWYGAAILLEEGSAFCGLLHINCARRVHGTVFAVVESWSIHIKSIVAGLQWRNSILLEENISSLRGIYSRKQF